MLPVGTASDPHLEQVARRSAGLCRVSHCAVGAFRPLFTARCRQHPAQLMFPTQVVSGIADSFCSAAVVRARRPGLWLFLPAVGAELADLIQAELLALPRQVPSAHQHSTVQLTGDAVR